MTCIFSYFRSTALSDNHRYNLFMLTRSTHLRTILIFCLLPLFSCAPPEENLRMYEQEKVLMGTAMKIKAETTNIDEEKTREAFNAAFRKISELESDLSEWRETSPVSEVAQKAGKEKVAVPQPVVTVTLTALDIARITDGAFDVTFLPLGKLWNVKNRKIPPSADSIAKAKAKVDYRQIELDTLRRTLFLKKEGMKIGFGGIAKGYAAWQAGEVLRRHGITNFIINAGGDLYVSGRKKGGLWTSGIKNPDAQEERPVVAFRVKKPCGIATSGDYENYFTWRGKRYHHIIDLKTGYPSEGLKSATVFSDDPAKADAYATAFFIMGNKKALQVILQDPSAAFILIDRENRLLRSPNLGHYIEEFSVQESF